MHQDLLKRILSGERPALTLTHPIHDLESGEVAALEILTRFENGGGRLKTAGDLLEDQGLDPASRVDLDLICLDSAFQALRHYPLEQRLVFLNLHPLTLMSDAFWDRIQPWLESVPVKPHDIVLEITESFGGHDPDGLAARATRLRSLGLRLAVDDLGSGVASLSHMAKLAPDFFKVDRCLVEQVHRRPHQAALLNALAVFAERMSLGYIVEGIETANELQAVIDAGVPWGQGFIFGEPVQLRGCS